MRETPQTMNLLYPHGRSNQEKFPALCFLLGPTRMGSSAQRPKIENRKLTELIFLTPPTQITILVMNENYSKV